MKPKYYLITHLKNIDVMEFCLERFALYKLNNHLADGRKSLFPKQSLTIAIAGFPDYTLQSDGFSSLINEIHKCPKNFYAALEDWRDIKDFPTSTTDLFLVHRRLFYVISDEELQEFSREVNRTLQPDGLVVAFHKTCLLEGKERFARAIKQRLGFIHSYRRSLNQFRRLTSPLVTILEAEVEDDNSYVSDRFCLSVLSKNTTKFPEYKNFPLIFTLESYNPDYWSQRAQPILAK